MMVAVSAMANPSNFDISDYPDICVYPTWGAARGHATMYTCDPILTGTYDALNKKLHIND